MINQKNYKCKNIRIVVSIILLFIFTAVSYLSKIVISNPSENIKNETKKQIVKIYSERCKAFITSNITPLKKYYDLSMKLSRWSFTHEIKRIKYLNTWADARGIKFKKVTSKVRIKKISTYNEFTKAYLEEMYKFDYCYNCMPNVVNSFGIGIRHVVKLMRTSKSNIIYNDWYTDCFEDSLEGITTSVSSSAYPVSVYKSFRNNLIGGYKREQAVKYADKYCGAAWGSKNNFNYNPKYIDFNFAGGDCTNFTSQVLGDIEGGSLPFDSIWFCDYPKYGKAIGSHAWVNTDGLKHYLLYSGKGSTLISGTFKNIFDFLNNNRETLNQKFQLGDVVCYEKKGNVDHFAVITGFDSQGYPLVNSHTTDRYHVPWDLGWGNKCIRFCFIHINY